MTQQASSHYLFKSTIPKFSKPFIHHHLFIQQSTANKRFYKYIHSLQLTNSLGLNFKTTSLKILNSLDLISSPCNPSSLQIRRMQKFAKPRSKFIKSFKEDSKQPEIQKLLPLLTRVTLDYNHHKWRLLATHSKIQAFSIDFSQSQYAHRKDSRLKKIYTYYQNTFSQYISRMRNLKKINLYLDGWDLERILLIFNLFEKVDLLRFVPLEHFRLKILPSCEDYFETVYEKNLKNNQIFRFLTELHVEDSKWFYSTFDGILFEKLSVLQIKISSMGNISYNHHLKSFKNLQKLKKLDLTFKVHSLQAEGEFLESFTLPKNLETIYLTLVNFRWSDVKLQKKNRRNLQAEFDNEQRFLLFFGQWKELKNLKNLSLTIKEDLPHSLKRCPGIAGNFASRTIRQLKSLENVCYTHTLSQTKFTKTTPGVHVKPLNLEEFWKALGLSKKTLRSIVIDVSEIAFPPAMKSLDKRFPCLKKISLGKRILWAKDLTPFCNEFRSLGEVEMEELRFNDEERLERFLQSLTRDSKVGNVNFGINLEGLRGEFLMHCLNELVEKISIQQGNVKLSFQNIEIKEGEVNFIKFCEGARLKKFRVEMAQENTLVLTSGKYAF